MSETIDLNKLTDKLFAPTTNAALRDSNLRNAKRLWEIHCAAREITTYDFTDELTDRVETLRGDKAQQMFFSFESGLPLKTVNNHMRRLQEVDDNLQEYLST